MVVETKVNRHTKALAKIIKLGEQHEGQGQRITVPQSLWIHLLLYYIFSGRTTNPTPLSPPPGQYVQQQWAP